MARTENVTEQVESPEVTYLSYREFEKINNGFEADAYKEACQFSRRNVTLGDEFILDSSKLAKDKPEKAVSQTFSPRFKINPDISGPLVRGLGEDEINGRLETLTAAAKLIAARDNLQLTPKKREEYEGLIENVLGLDAYAEGKGMTRRQFIRVAAVGAVSGLLTACTSQSLVKATEIFSSPDRPTISAPLPTVEPSKTPEPTKTPEPSYKINANFPQMTFEELVKNYESVSSKFSNVTLEDITSGKLLEYEEAWVVQHPVFTDEAKNGKMIMNYLIDTDGDKADFPYIFGNLNYQNNPNERPMKIISYYQFKDEKLFAELGIDPIKNNRKNPSGSNWPFWMVTWAYHNPSGKTTLGHSLVDIFNHVSTLDDLRKQGKSFKPLPAYKFEKMILTEEKAKTRNDLVTYFLWKQYPDLQANDSLIKQWIKTNEMPEDLQKALFWLDFYPNDWS